jgi:uncharacterized protein YjdB
MSVIPVSRAAAILTAVALVAACSDGITDPPASPDPIVGPMSVEPASATIEPGQSLVLRVRLAPEVFTLPGYTVAIKWMSNDPSVASVSAGGEVLGLSEGEAVITATAYTLTGEKTQISTIRVAALEPSPEVTPPRPNMEPWRLHQ